ncbi:MAG: hypothetical protein JNN25_09500 [Candidatus Kapabacteria bacterium]|nr:hypothetical protein [Candidatus Kapabacteria bacterium]
MLRCCWTLFFAILAVVSGALAQTPLSTKRLTVEHGLSQNSVQDFLQDRRGFMWFGTSDGLNRYDGYTFTIFRHNDRDSTTIAHNWVAALLEDRVGMLWVGTAQGISVWNPKIDRFTTYRHNPSDPHSIGADGVLFLYEDRQGNIWIGMQTSGLYMFDRATQRFVRYAPGLDNSQGLRSGRIMSFCEDDKGRLWVGTVKGLHLFDRAGGTFTYCDLGAISFPNEPIRPIYKDKRGMLWLGTTNTGLYCFNPETRSVLRHWSKGASPHELANNFINTIYESRDGRFWIGSQEGGLQTLNRETGLFHTYALDVDDSGNDTGVYTILGVKEDRAGVLWISTNSGGLRMHSIFDERFTSYRHYPKHPNSLSHNDVLCLHEDRAGIVWIGTYGGGLNRFDPKTRTFTVFRHESNNTASLGYDYIRAIHEDRFGTLWIGTFGGGLCRFDRNSDGSLKRCTTYRNNTSDTTSISNNYIWKLSEDNKGNLWAGTDDGKLNKLDRMSLQQGIVRFTKFSLRRDRLTSVQTLYHDRSGTLWVGTWGAGLRQFDTASGNFLPTVQFLRGDTASIAVRNVISICEDRRGALWYGTYGGGLYRWDKSKKGAAQELVRFTADQGLPNEIVYGILEDRRGRLWISTNKGIAVLTCADTTKPAEQPSYRIRAFEASDGLQSNEFNRGAYTKFASGMMAFGGVGGFTLFHPDSVRDNPHSPDVVITGFRKFNRLVPLDSAVTEKTTLELEYTDTFFSFEFAGLDYVNPLKHQYAYKLENFDENWIQAGTQRSVNYTNLDAGEYVFRVRAANSDGVWSQNDAALRVLIRPPFWKSWWFRLGAGFSILALVWSIYRNRVRSIERRNRELQRLVDERTVEIRRQITLLDSQAREIQEVNAVLALKNTALEESNGKLAEADRFKTRILSIAAHDLKNPLGAIIGFAELVLSELEPSSRFLPMMEAMSRSAAGMLDLIKNILDLSAVEMGRMELSKEVVDFAYVCVNASEPHAMAAEQKSQSIVFDVESSCMVYADIVRLGQVVDNLVSNAVKYSPFGAEIRISVKRNHAFSRLEVRDQGPGLTEEDRSKLFGFFQRLSARPTGNESSNGVGLAIVKQIVELHGGRVWAESVLGSGSTFIVEMPLVNQEGA